MFETIVTYIMVFAIGMAVGLFVVLYALYRCIK